MRRVPFNLDISWLEEGTVVFGRRISQDAKKLSKPITRCFSNTQKITLYIFRS